MGKVVGDIKVIAKNDEKYISIDKKVPIGKKNCWKLRLLNSYGFLQASLEKLVVNLVSAVCENFKTVSEEFDPTKTDLLLRKGVFPYELLDDVERLNETQLPAIEAFHNTFRDENISTRITNTRRKCGMRSV